MGPSMTDFGSSSPMFRRALYIIGGVLNDLVSMRSKGNGPIDDAFNSF